MARWAFFRTTHASSRTDDLERGDTAALRIGALTACLAAVAARVVLSTATPSGTDLRSYQEVLRILHEHRPLYETTLVYNYAPLWAWVLLALDATSRLTAARIEMVVRLFLTGCDVLCAALLFQLARRRDMPRAWQAPVLFLANPVLVWITGAQGQFDSLMMMFLLAALLLTPRRDEAMRAPRLLPMLALGLSMAFKHAVAVHPLLWRRRFGWRAGIPYAVFAATLLPYGREWRSILSHVLLYRSVPQSYGLAEFVLWDRRWALPIAALAVAALLMTAWRLQEYDLCRSSLILFLVLLVLAPGVGAQYFYWPLTLGVLFPSIGFWMTTAGAGLWIAAGRFELLGSGRYAGHLAWLCVLFWLVREVREYLRSSRRRRVEM